MGAKTLFVMVCCLVVLVYAGDVPQVSGQTLQVSDDTDRTFGVVEAYYRPDEAVMLGATWDRVVFPWYRFQPDGPNEFVTGYVPQTYIDQANAQNRQIVGVIRGTPAWASFTGSPGGVPYNLGMPLDHPRNYYANFLRQLVAYYSERGIHHWIIMNEPDVREGEGVVEFRGDVDDYFEMLRVAYKTIKETDPTAHVQIAGMAWWPDRNAGREPYLERLLRLIRDDPEHEQYDWYFDGVSLHIYYTTSTVLPIIEAHQSFLERYGLLETKEIWLSEYNASPHLDPVPQVFEAPFEVTPMQQANYIVQASALALSAGVDRMSVYRLYDNHFTPGLSEPWGLVRWDGSLRPAFHAYQQVINRFTGAQEINRYETTEATMVTARFPDRTVYVMWSNGQKSNQFQIIVPPEFDVVEVYNAMGESWFVPVTVQGTGAIASIEAPGAEMIDMPWTVVAGDVRVVELPGLPRTTWVRSVEDGWTVQLR